MRLLRVVGWSLVFAVTGPFWVILAALELLARPIRWVSRACVRVVEPVATRWVLAIREYRAAKLPPLPSRVDTRRANYGRAMRGGRS